jgi:hypothetical protein
VDEVSSALAAAVVDSLEGDVEVVGGAGAVGAGVPLIAESAETTMTPSTTCAVIVSEVQLPQLSALSHELPLGLHDADSRSREHPMAEHNSRCSILL